MNQNELLAGTERISKAMSGGDYDERRLQKGITGGAKKSPETVGSEARNKINIYMLLEFLNHVCGQ